MKRYSLTIALSIIVIAVIVLLIFCNYKSVSYDKYSLNKALDYYGFISPKQKEAVQTLFQQSSIIPVGMTLDQVFLLRDTQEEVANDIIDVLEATQRKFIVRSGVQERWEAKALAWMGQDKDETLSSLRTLGFVDPIAPKQKKVDAVCILGAAAPRMADRINYLDYLMQSGLTTKAVILLSGERYVIKGVDGTKEELIQIANKAGLEDWTKLTETDLIKEQYRNSALYNSNDIDVYIVDVPKGNLPRPTTQSTVLELTNWLKTHDGIRNIVFVSNQPYVHYQRAIIDAIFKANKVHVKYEVVGSEAKALDNLQPILEGFGSYVWAATPTVFSEMGIQIKNELIKKLLKELYANHPLIYKTIPQNFTQ
jgi:hypothetical protein